MRSIHHQRGFALISAVLLITGILAVATVSALLLSGRSVTTAQGLEALRAHYAAHSGINVAASQAISGGCASVSGTLVVESFSVVLTCQSWTLNEAGEDYAVYRLSATAARGSIDAGTLVSRTLRATVTDAL